MTYIRLDRFLADRGEGSRSQVKQLLKKGFVKVNGAPAAGPEQKIDAGLDLVMVKDRPVDGRPFRYYMLNKPSGVVTAVTDARERTVMDFMKDEKVRGLFPVGRLDKDTEGLLLITNDGELAHRLLSPAHHVKKTYYVRVEGKITEETVAHFLEGIDIGEKKRTLPALLEPAGPDGNSASFPECTGALVTVVEGKFHQIKRMFHAEGLKVLYLKRLSMGGIELDESLLPGGYRELTGEETALLKGEAYAAKTR